MARLGAWKTFATALLFCAATGTLSPAQTFTSLLSFNGADGANPVAVSLAQGIDGDFYGTTENGGANNGGTVFKVTPAGALTTLYSFCEYTGCSDGSLPSAGLVLATDGNFYGTTQFGGSNNCTDGCGTIYKVTPEGILTTLYDFCAQAGCVDGVRPYGALVQATDGNFYGMTSSGGVGSGCYINRGCGTVFRLTPRATITTLYAFCSQAICADGGTPLAGLLQGTDGDFYGTTAHGGTNGSCYQGCGTVFRITSAGSRTTIYNFCAASGCSDGSSPEDSLVQASDGNFYGTTVYGGGSSCNDGEGLGCGTVFRVTRRGTLTTIHRFDRLDGYNPIAGLVQATDRNLYGTTLTGGPGRSCLGSGRYSGCGTLFEVTPEGLTTLHTFESSDGANLYGGLLQSTNGTFYGATYGGGANPDYGTAFSLDMGLGPFVAFVHNSGKVGQTGGILGQGFTGTTSVSLNGVSASFTVVSDTFITATIPPGATSGFVQVVTPTVTLSSNVPFQVIP